MSLTIVSPVQSLSIDPVNHQVLELLGMALEATTAGGPKMSDEEWKNMLKSMTEKYSSNTLTLRKVRSESGLTCPRTLFQRMI